MFVPPRLIIICAAYAVDAVEICRFAFADPLLTSNGPVNVPTLVRDEAVTPEARVAPVNVPAAAVIVVDPPSDTPEPLMVTPLFAKALLGIEDSRLFDNVPDVILLAFVVSVVAEAAKPETAPEAMAIDVFPAAVSCP